VSGTLSDCEPLPSSDRSRLLRKAAEALLKARTFHRNELRQIALGFSWMATHNSKVELQDNKAD
jgi:hypothetical protein